MNRHFKLAFRKLTKNKYLLFVNVAGLSVGVAAFIMLLYYANYESSFDAFHKDTEKIYRVESVFYPIVSSSDEMATSSFGYGPAMKKDIPGVNEFCRINHFRSERDIKYQDIVYRENFVVWADSNFFTFFSFPLLQGDKHSVLSQPNTIVISESAAHKYFNRENPMGKVLEVRGSGGVMNLTVSGVFKDIPLNSHIQFDFLMSYPYSNGFLNNTWYMHEAYTYIKVQSPELIEGVEKKFIEISENYTTRPALSDKTWAIDLVPLSDIHLNKTKAYELEEKGNKKSVKLLILVAFFIIIIAWINYINMSTTKSLERAGEVAIFKIHGACFPEVLKLTLAESLLVNLLSFGLSILLIFTTIPLVIEYLSGDIFAGFWSSYYLWLPLLSAFLLGVILTGAAPAFLMMRMNRNISSSSSSVLKGGNSRLREGLLVAQFVTSIVLIIGTLSVRRQVNYMQSMKLGVDIEQTLVFKAPPFTNDYRVRINKLKEDVKSMAEVNWITTSSSVPGASVSNMLSNYNPSDPERENNLYEMLRVDNDYVPAYGLELLAGRNFSFGNAADNTAVLLTQTSRKLFGFESDEQAIGRDIILEGTQTADKPFRVIGILKDFHHLSVKENFKPVILFNSSYHSWIQNNFFSVKLNSADLHSSVSAIANMYNENFKGTSFNYFFLDEKFNSQYNNDIKFGKIFSVFSWLGIFIVCLGLLGLASFMLLKRTKEIGVRKVNGAKVPEILTMLNLNFLKWVALASLLAFPLAHIMVNKWLGNFAQRTNVPIWIYLLSGVLVLLITLLTVSVQSWRAASRNPVEALKYE